MATVQDLMDKKSKISAIKKPSTVISGATKKKKKKKNTEEQLGRPWLDQNENIRSAVSKLLRKENVPDGIREEVANKLLSRVERDNDVTELPIETQIQDHFDGLDYRTTEKHKVHIGTKDSVIDSIKDSAIDSIKDSAIDSTKDSVIDSTKDSAIDSTKDSVIDSIKDSAIDSIKDSVIDSIKDSAIDSIKDSAIDSTKDSVIDSTKDSAIDSIKDSAIDSTKDSAIDSTKDSVIDSTKDSVIDSITDSAIDSIKDSSIDSTKDSAIDSTKDRAIDSTKDSVIDSTKDSVIDSTKDSAKNSTVKIRNKLNINEYKTNLSVNYDIRFIKSSNKIVIYEICKLCILNNDLVTDRTTYDVIKGKSKLKIRGIKTVILKFKQEGIIIEKDDYFKKGQKGRIFEISKQAMICMLAHDQSLKRWVASRGLSLLELMYFYENTRG